MRGRRVGRVVVICQNADLRPQMGRAALLYRRLVDMYITLDPRPILTARQASTTTVQAVAAVSFQQRKEPVLGVLERW